MNKKFLPLILITLSVTFLIIAQQKTTETYENRWKKVDEFSNQQLPKSALKEVEAILEQANKEKNFVQQVKASLSKMRFTLETEPDKAAELVQNFESLIVNETETDRKAILQSITAEMYTDLYLKNAWNINNRTKLNGETPNDIDEWTQNIWFDKITSLLSKSTQNIEVLEKNNASLYNELTENSTDSMHIEPTLYDFLVNRKIEVLKELENYSSDNLIVENENIYAQASDFIKMSFVDANPLQIKNQILESYRLLLASNLKLSNNNALIFNDLKRLDYVNNLLNKPADYMQALDEICKNQAENEIVVEALFVKANHIFRAEEKDFRQKANEICTWGIEKYPNYFRINILRNLQKEIGQKSIQVQHIEHVQPNSILKIQLISRNIQNITIDVYRVNSSAIDYSQIKRNSNIDKSKQINRTKIASIPLQFKNFKNLDRKDTIINIQTGNFGIYEIDAYETNGLTDKKIANTGFVVTNLAFINRSTKEYSQDMYVLHRKSGVPQPKVTVKAYSLRWRNSGYDLQLTSTSKTYKSGFCTLNLTENYGNQEVFMELGDDKYFSTTTYNYFNGYYLELQNNEMVNIFTDRSIYRPGQVVYFKGIAYFNSKQSNQIQANATFEVSLFDANNQKISTKNVTTNEFGSFTGEFILPTKGLNGAYDIRVKGEQHTIYVEEYKRPTFEVTVDKPKQEIYFGKSTTLCGNVKSFAGYAVGDARVNFRILRSTHRYCWWWNEPETEITNGITKTNADGSFSITFTPEKSPIQRDAWRGNYYTYTLIVDVTDPKGETQEGEQYFSVGDKSLFIIANIPAKTEKNQLLNLQAHTENLQGERTKTEISYEIYRLEDVAELKEMADSVYKNVEKISSGTINANESSNKLSLKSWKSGRYRIILKATDAQGNEVKHEQLCIIYADEDKKPPVKTYSWLVTKNTKCAVGEVANIRFGTSLSNATVLYELMQGNKIIVSKWVKFNNEIRDFNIIYKKEFGAGVTVLFTYIKDEQFYNEQIQITRKNESKKLSPKLSVFRNKLLPGEKAEWTLTIPETDSLKKQAEVLISMYDASLAAIRPHNWAWNPNYLEEMQVSPVWAQYNTEMSSDIVFSEYQFDNISEYLTREFNWQGLNLGNSNRNYQIRIRGAKSKSLSEDMIAEEIVVVESLAAPQDIKTSGIALVPPPPPVPGTVEAINIIDDTKKQAEKPKIRTNFNETAFFYPQLRTDAHGNVKFTFTAPESLTRWNVKMLAHTTDLFNGYGEESIQTQKELMVQMNLPRFVRKSDKLTLSASVINLSDKELATTANFELINPENEQVIKIQDVQAKKITLKPNETKVVSWEINEFKSLELVICKVIASAGNFSDGEQRYLPVLPDKVLVTESLPLIIRSNQTRQFTFDSFLKNQAKVENNRFTIEFSSNPVWYAIQALPYLSAPGNENATDYLTAFYSNTLSQFIIQSNPKIASVFEQWKRKGGTRDALLSNLEQNPELKNMLLEETPWVMNAQNESEQKQRIALLFDLNLQRNQGAQYLEKLFKLQTANGGFSWFEGMGESRYQTQEILLHLARLAKLTNSAFLSAYNEQISKALYYLDSELAKDFYDLKKYNKKYLSQNCINHLQLMYLHLRTEYEQIPVQVTANEAFKYYNNQAEKYWTSFSLSGKASVALIAYRNGKIQLAEKILKSLRENATSTDEMGMYWAKNTAGMFWNERPVTVHTALIEAFNEISKDNTELDELKIWLLKQKQTQMWDSPIASVNAIYALMLRGNDWLNNTQNTTIQLGSKIVQTSGSEAGTGYLKQSYSGNEIAAEMGKIKISSTGSQSGSAQIGWGSAYWQYYSNLDKIETQGGPLKIKKDLFVKNQDNTLTPIVQKQPVVGNRITTRLVITTDRNLEFVALKDLRAACLEPVKQQSGYVWRDGIGYYQTTKDASTQFFFNWLPKGTYVFEYDQFVNNSGEFASGIASLQCLYAPEFNAHSRGERMTVGK